MFNYIVTQCNTFFKCNYFSKVHSIVLSFLHHAGIDTRIQHSWVHALSHHLPHILKKDHVFYGLFAALSYKIRKAFCNYFMSVCIIVQTVNISGFCIFINIKKCTAVSFRNMTEYFSRFF